MTLAAFASAKAADALDPDNSNDSAAYAIKISRMF
jgi:hypothetical protein